MDFAEAADSFHACVRVLGNSRRVLGNAERLISEGAPGDMRRAQLAEMEIRYIGEKIDETMAAYDRLRRALKYAPRYASFLESRRVAR
jgi:hypothetical protein